jgi:protein TonB
MLDDVTNTSQAPANTSSNSSLSGRTISGGVLNGKAANLPQPTYPPAARAVRAAGVVNVQVTVDERGDVVSAEAVSGHPLLRAAAVAAARQAKFAPTKLSGQSVKVTGVITYNFVMQ